MFKTAVKKMTYFNVFCSLFVLLLLSACDSQIYHLTPDQNTVPNEVIYGDLGHTFIFKEGVNVDLVVGISKYTNNKVFFDNLVTSLFITNKSDQRINIDYQSINLYGIKPNGQRDLLQVVDPEQFITSTKNQQLWADILVGLGQALEETSSAYQTSNSHGSIYANGHYAHYSSTTTTYDSSKADIAKLRHQIENDKRSASNEKINRTLKTGLLVKQTIFPKGSIDKFIIFKLKNEAQQDFSQYEKFQFVIQVLDETFSGIFQNILYENKEINYENGDIYRGTTYNGKKHGHGEYIWATGEIYEGEWKNDLRNGNGKNIWPSGEIYEGEWKDGLRDGHGKYIWTTGAHYEGDWVLDLREGANGKYITEDKTTFMPVSGEGQFENNLMTGKFKKISASGEESIVTDPQ